MHYFSFVTSACTTFVQTIQMVTKLQSISILPPWWHTLNWVWPGGEGNFSPRGRNGQWAPEFNVCNGGIFHKGPENLKNQKTREIK